MRVRPCPSLAGISWAISALCLVQLSLLLRLWVVTMSMTCPHGSFPLSLPRIARCLVSCLDFLCSFLFFEGVVLGSLFFPWPPPRSPPTAHFPIPPSVSAASAALSRLHLVFSLLLRSHPPFSALGHAGLLSDTTAFAAPSSAPSPTFGLRRACPPSRCSRRLLALAHSASLMV